jgi:1,2-diacylglycerol 3-beta-glucosyltransferase
MRENSWPEKDSYSELDNIETLLDDDLQSDLFQGLEGRRRKAAVVLAMVWSGTIALHLFSWGIWVVFGLAGMFSLHIIRLLLTHSLPVPEPLAGENPSDYPYVSLLVAAKNEEAVIGNLVKMLCNLDYPAERYEVWVIDDRSTDRTPAILDRLAGEYKQLQVLHRSAGASGGKSGALNQTLLLTRGEIIAVFDADARVTPDLLRRVVPCFNEERVGAVQVQKAVVNRTDNFWIEGQIAEMALDTHLQQHRVAIGGIGELRGNGQFVRRSALKRCGGWNEETITDDLDLTIRLHLDGWDIQILEEPVVGEEGVTKALDLWHQRNRWAEGGYQRYLDYWRPIFRQRLGTRKTIDLFFSFVLIQYLLPTAVVPDFLMALARHRPPILMPLTSCGFALSFATMFVGLRRSQKNNKPFVALLQAIKGMVYMLHWFVVIASTTARMSIRPKQLKWVKTVHEGSEEVLLETES